MSDKAEGTKSNSISSNSASVDNQNEENEEDMPETLPHFQLKLYEDSSWFYPNSTISNLEDYQDYLKKGASYIKTHGSSKPKYIMPKTTEDQEQNVSDEEKQVQKPELHVFYTRKTKNLLNTPRHCGASLLFSVNPFENDTINIPVRVPVEQPEKEKVENPEQPQPKRSPRLRSMNKSQPQPVKKVVTMPEEDCLKCIRITEIVLQNPYSSGFRAPVDPQVDGASDYLNIIKKPMDLGTILDNLRNGHYTTVSAWRDDFELIWENAGKYNPPASKYYISAIKLKEKFQKYCQIFDQSDEELWLTKIRNKLVKVQDGLKEAMKIYE